MKDQEQCGANVHLNDSLGVTPEELREACALCLELVKLRQAECKHLCVENVAQEMLHGILSAILMAKHAWQPIETAPKDGTLVIIGSTRKMSGIHVAEFWGVCGEWFDGEYFHSPTHWMPLPQPPAAVNPDPTPNTHYTPK